MQNPHQESATSGPINLLKHYSFESNHQSYEKVLDSWLERFPLNWVNLALVESLYQGRYKVVSVEQILTLWQRRGKPSHHFNHDFERLVSNNLPKTFEKKGGTSTRSTPPNRFNPFPSPQRIKSQSPKLASFSTDSSRATKSTSPGTSTSPNVNHPQASNQKVHNVEAVKPIDYSVSDFQPDVTGETSLEATQPPTIMEETELKSTRRIENSQVSPRTSSISQESSSNDSSSSSSALLSTHIGETLNPIHQFVPQSSSTEFCSKLTAMAQING